jgi:hypothetical protein
MQEKQKTDWWIRKGRTGNKQAEERKYKLNE